MLDNWLESIKTMGIFLVCAQTLIHFKPKGSYEKYIRLLVSVMILVQLLEPVGNLLGILDKGELQGRIRSMEKKMMQIQEQSYAVNTKAEDIWNFLLQESEEEMIFAGEGRSETSDTVPGVEEEIHE